MRSEAELAPLLRVLERNEPGAARIRTPVRIAQGTADTTVFPAFTRQTQDELAANGTSSTLRTYEDLTHVSVITEDAPQVDALAFLRGRVR